MANKNKNIRKLVKSASHPSTDALSVIPTLTQAVSRPVSMLERNDKTFDVDMMPASRLARSKSELQQVVAAQSAKIADLEFRLEESRMRRQGLDEELRVREEITADINREIREARKQLMSAADELQRLNQTYLELRARHDESTAQSASLQASLEKQRQRVADKEGLVAELQATLRSTASELSDLRNYVEGRREMWEQQDAERAVLQAELEQMRDDNRTLRQSSRKDLVLELEENRRTIAAQSGQIAVQTAELETLRRDNERFESYSNDLRIKLQDQMDAARSSTSQRERSEANLGEASDTILNLTRQLETEKAKTQLLREANDRLQTRLDRSRAAPVDAQQPGSRHAVTRTIDRLKRTLQSARGRCADYEQKLRAKDDAISDLMQKLHDNNKKQKLTEELENALQKIDGKKTDRPDATGRGERITRQLIGSTDGKELRFPLFRKRLSIGRTRHNDIQLDLRFVSRRHAVIATENNTTRIIDWGSRNGVYVNKQRISEKILESGDVITIGLTNLRYEERLKR